VYREGARILRAGEIGEPYAADWRVFARMTTSNKYARTAWRRRPRYPGGFIFDGGIHNIAALRVMFGEIHPYAASSRRVNPALGPADTFTMHFETAGGVMGVFTLCFSAIGMDENKLVVLGTRGTMVIENDVIAVISRKRRAERFADDGGFKEEFMDFHRAIMQSTPVRSSFAEGFEDVKTILKGLRLSR
jgi:predicted dehydrogenase